MKLTEKDERDLPRDENKVWALSVNRPLRERIYTTIFFNGCPVGGNSNRKKAHLAARQLAGNYDASFTST